MEVITSHTNADFDTFASMVAAKKLYPDAVVAFSGSIEKGLKSALKDLPVSLETRKIKDSELRSITRLVLVDARQASRIGQFSGIIGKKGVEIHIYDHHPPSENDIRGDLVVSEQCGSTTTIMTLLLRDRAIELSPQEATVLMAGIYEDTGFLSYPTTTGKDYEAGAYLLSKGADLTRVSALLKKELTPEEVSLLNALLESESAYTVGGVDVSIVEGYIERYTGEISALAHRIMDIRGLNALFMLIDSEDRVHLVARSRHRAINAGIVAKALGGGGHFHAASATIKGVTLVEAKERLLSALAGAISPQERASDIMSTPVISIPASSAISEASELLRRFNINAAPVVENGRITGVATRQVLDKAVFHRLSQRPVTEYMTTEFETISPDAPVDEIRSKVSSIGARILPVVKGSTVIGVITRTDLLRLIQEEFKSGEAGPHEKKKDLSRAMEERLPKWVMERLKLAGATAERLGFKAYAVGGFARDILLRRENLDVDIVIEGGDGIVFAERLAKDQGLRVKSHQRFKTSVVLFPDGFKMDIATARLEYYEAPAVLPTVQPSSLKLDLYRRDFIMNTLAISLNPQTFGALTDFFGAERDIRDKVIRVIHNLSFVEDPTRAFRAVRFSEKFGFAISAHTLSLIKNSVKIDVFKRLGGARLLTELRNLLSEDAAKESIKRLSELRLLSVIHPSISPDQETLGLLERAKDSTAWHRLLYTEDKAEAWLTLLLALTHNLTEAQLKGLCRRLSMSGKKRLLAIEMRARGLDALRKIEAGGIARNSELWEALRPLPMETLLFLMAKTTDESARKAISSYVTRLRLTEPELKGRDLKRLGIPEGPVMGRVIAMLREKRLDNEITTRAEEEELARSAMKREDAG